MKGTSDNSSDQVKDQHACMGCSIIRIGSSLLLSVYFLKLSQGRSMIRSMTSFDKLLYRGISAGFAIFGIHSIKYLI